MGLSRADSDEQWRCAPWPWRDGNQTPQMAWRPSAYLAASSSRRRLFSRPVSGGAVSSWQEHRGHVGESRWTVASQPHVPGPVKSSTADARGAVSASWWSRLTAIGQFHVSPWSAPYTGEWGPSRANPDGQRRRDPMALVWRYRTPPAS